MEFKGTLVVTDMKLSEVAERALTFIKKDNVTYPELVNLYRNTAESKTINEIEREILTQALETVMRTSFPQQASNVLGRKDDKPVEVLEEVYNTVKTKFDLSGNLHKNGVKVSGDMIGGRSYIGWHISYKNRQGWGTSIAYRQKKSDTEPYLEVRIYQTGTKGQEDERHNCGLGNTSQAESDFLTCLELVDCPTS